ncbi:MAG TPA: TraR/DksA C4-type zinc finger protein [Acidimicrobiales bacterium]|nr:TraR/DksA C4-type zinc finger protein [Acidimicrobiales bacterium]
MEEREPALLREELRRARSGLEDLRAEFSELADPDAPSVDDEHDSEGSTIGFERARVAGLMAGAERRVSELEEATARARAGTYSVCEVCGAAIGAERLAALPATRRCVGCARGR